MTGAWSAALDIAQIVSGVAAAVAIGFGVREIRSRKREVADGVTAWAVTEGLDLDEDFLPGGVILANPTPLALRDVAVRTQRRTDAADRTLSDDGTTGQQFSLIPPGTFYLQQVTDPEGNDRGPTRWSAPMPVHTGDGQYVVTPPRPSDSDEDTAPGPVQLIPVAMTPEHKRVAFLRFTLADTTWHRNELTELTKGHGDPRWDQEFKDSLGRSLAAGVRQKHDHSPDTAVVDFYRAFFTWLTGASPAAKGKTAAPPRADFADLLREVRLTSKQQALELDLVSDQVGTGWFAGNGKGDIATQFAIPWKSLTRQRSVRDSVGRPFTRPAASVPTDQGGREAFFAELVEAVRAYLAAGPHR